MKNVIQKGQNNGGRQELHPHARVKIPPQPDALRHIPPKSDVLRHLLCVIFSHIQANLAHQAGFARSPKN